LTTPPALDVFISHSSRDAELAKAIVELLRSALSLPAERIGCTSVAGYKLPIGADTNDQLRRETVEARVLLGLITEVSVESAYVLFELGARWGARRYLAPLMGAGRGAELLAGPLSGLNALSCSREDLFQLVSDLAGELACVPAAPQVYSGHVDHAVHVSEDLAAQRGLSEAPPATHSESFSDMECDYLMETAGHGTRASSSGRSTIERGGRSPPTKRR
jgi:hypothetical protein